LLRGGDNSFHVKLLAHQRDNVGLGNGLLFANGNRVIFIGLVLILRSVKPMAGNRRQAYKTR
jgi:hypothetical protein